jgi:hypothetical protein
MAACVGPPPRPALPPRPWKIVSSRPRSLASAVGAEHLPLGGEVPAVLARVGVPHHHLEPGPSTPYETAESRLLEQVLDDAGRRAERGDRLEERHERELEACVLGHVERGEHVGRRGGAGHDQGVECLCAMHLAYARDGADCLGHSLRPGVELVGVQAHVELREVEAEQLDPAPERGQPSVRHALRPVRAQARVDHREVGREVGGGFITRS